MAERLKPGGLLVLETPDINTLPFRIMKARWRQFIPEHYFFFDHSTITKLLSETGFKVERIMRIGKHSSVALILNRMSRYFRFQATSKISPNASYFGFTFRIDPLDIMIVFAVRI